MKGEPSSKLDEEEDPGASTTNTTNTTRSRSTSMSSSMTPRQLSRPKKAMDWLSKCAKSHTLRSVLLAAALVVCTAVPVFVVWEINTNDSVDNMVSRTITEASALVSYKILSTLSVLDEQVEAIFDAFRLDRSLLQPGHLTSLWNRQASAMLRDSTYLSTIVVPSNPDTFDPYMAAGMISQANVTFSMVTPRTVNISLVAYKDPFIANGTLCLSTVSFAKPGLSRLMCSDRLIRWNMIFPPPLLNGGSLLSEPTEQDGRLLIDVSKVLFLSNRPVAWAISGIEVTILTEILSEIDFPENGFGYLMDKTGHVVATLGSASVNSTELGRAFPHNCSDLRVVNSWNFIKKRIGRTALATTEQLSYNDELGGYKLNVDVLEPFPGVNWTIVLAISTRMYTENVTQSVQSTALITAAIVATVLLLGILSSISLTRKGPTVFPETKLDLDAGITKIIDKLKELRKTADNQNKITIDEIIQNITHTTGLFMPDLRKQTGLLDSDIQKWLNDEIAPAVLQDSPHGKHKSKKLHTIAVMPPCDLNLDTFGFDVFDIPSEGILERVAMQALSSLGVLPRLKISSESVRAFIAEIETHYKNNAYHNSIHAADVVQCLYFLLTNGLRHILGSNNDWDIFTLIIAGVVHDVGHPGVNNAFLVSTGDELALHYNDRSVLENFHASFSGKLIITKYAAEWGLSLSDLKYVRGLLISLVLATDVSLHFEIVSKFKTLLEDSKCNFKDNKDHRSQLLCMAMKTADISNVMRPHKQMLRWVKQLTDEFFAQGDQERQRGLPLSPFTDREDGLVKLPKLQTNFISLIADPLLQTIDRVFPLPALKDNLAENSQFWGTNPILSFDISGK
ncbi:3'5'-cyclic nucleotide phosphodiesterase [Pelomyxa schiedti]|nr:3'5'-cyclic nucleotide phosphodiesterase [Pelomyxa schiedti]